MLIVKTGSKFRIRIFPAVERREKVIEESMQSGVDVTSFKVIALREHAAGG